MKESSDLSAALAGIRIVDVLSCEWDALHLFVGSGHNKVETKVCGSDQFAIPSACYD